MVGNRSRQWMWLALSFGLVLMSLTIACGPVDGETAIIDHPTRADVVIVRVERSSALTSEKQLMNDSWSLVWALMGNGDLIRHGSVALTSTLPSLRVNHLAEDQVQAILRQAESAGLLDGARQHSDPGTISVTNRLAGWMIVSTKANGQRSTVASYARGTLRDPIEDFVLDILEEHARSIVPSGEESGTLYDIKQMRLMVQPTDRWSSSDGNQRLGPSSHISWPLDVPAAEFGESLDSPSSGIRCGIVAGQDLAKWLAALEHEPQSIHFESAGEVYAVSSRILLPGDEPTEICSIPDPVTTLAPSGSESTVLDGTSWALATLHSTDVNPSSAITLAFENQKAGG